MKAYNVDYVEKGKNGEIKLNIAGMTKLHSLTVVVCCCRIWGMGTFGNDVFLLGYKIEKFLICFLDFENPEDFFNIKNRITFKPIFYF